MDLKFNKRTVLIKIAKMPVRKSQALKSMKKQVILKIIQKDILKEAKTIMAISKWISMKKIEEGLYKITILANILKMINKDNQENMKMASMSHRCMKKNTRLATCILVDHYFHYYKIIYRKKSFLMQRDDLLLDLGLDNDQTFWNLLQAISFYLLKHQ